MNNFGFIITRHVNSETTNKYWNHSVQLLRRLYPLKKIVIIDDNSNQEFVKSEFDYKNIEIVKSEFPGRGELLPYYYFLKNKYFENAVILHDSVFFHKRIPFELLQNVEVLPLWHFNPDTEDLVTRLHIISNLTNYNNIYEKLKLHKDLLGMSQLINKSAKWYGCFGVQSYINHNFLLKINNKYNIINLLKVITTRPDRCCLERILGCIFFTESNFLYKRKSLFGDIFKYQKWGLTFDQYINKFNKGQIEKTVMKVWSGR
jgi:hypothetical protein